MQLSELLSLMFRLMVYATVVGMGLLGYSILLLRTVASLRYQWKHRQNAKGTFIENRWAQKLSREQVFMELIKTLAGQRRVSLTRDEERIS